jgi:hypothetical protein
MEVTMTHTCTACGEENNVLPPTGYTLKRRPVTLAENDFGRLDPESEPALIFREAYRRESAARRRQSPW